MRRAAREVDAPAPDRGQIPALRRALLRWYRATARDLPWRRTRDPYRIWLSEVLLQQTRVETVIPYYERFLAELPNVYALAQAPLERVLGLWAGLGYYTRARNLQRAAQVVAHERGGEFPCTADGWEQLPGVGRYTAAAIASIADGRPVATVDGNIQRVLARLFRVKGNITTAATRQELWRLADELLARRSPGDFNQALMELGARVCTPRVPRCAACPLTRWCAARQAGVQEVLPQRGARRTVPEVVAVAGVLRRGPRVLLVQRTGHGLLRGMWTLPGAEVTNGAGPAEVLRAAFAALGIRVAVGAVLGRVRHQFTHRLLQVEVYACRVQGTPPPGGEHARWVSPAELAQVPLATLDRKLLSAAEGAERGA